MLVSLLLLHLDDFLPLYLLHPQPPPEPAHPDLLESLAGVGDDLGALAPDPLSDRDGSGDIDILVLVEMKEVPVPAGIVESVACKTRASLFPAGDGVGESGREHGTEGWWMTVEEGFAVVRLEEELEEDRDGRARLFRPRFVPCKAKLLDPRLDV